MSEREFYLQGIECDLLENQLVHDFSDAARNKRSAKRTLPVDVEEFTIIIGQNTLIPVGA